MERGRGVIYTDVLTFIIRIKLDELGEKKKKEVVCGSSQETHHREKRGFKKAPA